MEDISNSRQTFLLRQEPAKLFLTNSPTSYGHAEMFSADSISNILEISLSSSLPLPSLPPNAVRTSEQLNPAGISAFSTVLIMSEDGSKQWLLWELNLVTSQSLQYVAKQPKARYLVERSASSVMETDRYLGEISHSVSSSAGGGHWTHSCEAHTLTDR